MPPWRTAPQASPPSAWPATFQYCIRFGATSHMIQFGPSTLLQVVSALKYNVHDWRASNPPMSWFCCLLFATRNLSSIRLSPESWSSALCLRLLSEKLATLRCSHATCGLVLWFGRAAASRSTVHTRVLFCALFETEVAGLSVLEFGCPPSLCTLSFRKDLCLLHTFFAPIPDWTCRSCPAALLESRIRLASRSQLSLFAWPLPAFVRLLNPFLWLFPIMLCLDFRNQWGFYWLFPVSFGAH